MAYEIVKRVFRQHSSLVIVLPLYLRKLLNIRQGDHVVFHVEDDQGNRVIFSKLNFGEYNHGRGSGDSD